MMLMFLKNIVKYGKKTEELMGIDFEGNPPFCNNITYTTKIKSFTLFRRLSGHKNSKKRNNL